MNLTSLFENLALQTNAPSIPTKGIVLGIPKIIKNGQAVTRSKQQKKKFSTTLRMVINMYYIFSTLRIVINILPCFFMYIFQKRGYPQKKHRNYIYNDCQNYRKLVDKKYGKMLISTCKLKTTKKKTLLFFAVLL